MAFGLAFSNVRYGEAFRQWNAPVANAVLAAFKETAAAIVRKGRDDIAAGGFTSRWQRGFTVRVRPNRNVANIAADEFSMQVRHRMPYIAIFQEGGTIKGKPLLWLPLPGIPQKIGGRHMTPSLFAKEIGPLVMLHRQPPLLLGSIRGARKGKIGLAALRRGAAAGGDKVPVFVGLSSVTVRKRIHINEIVAAEAAQIYERYEEAFVG